MEENVDTVIGVLTGQDWQSPQSLAQEQYTEEDFARPGTLTFTVNITDDKPTCFNYGWCAVDEETLRQNFEHISVKPYFNGDVLGSDVAHNLSYTSTNNRSALIMQCCCQIDPPANISWRPLPPSTKRSTPGLRIMRPGTIYLNIV